MQDLWLEALKYTCIVILTLQYEHNEHLFNTMLFCDTKLLTFNNGTKFEKYLTPTARSVINIDWFISDLIVVYRVRRRHFLFKFKQTNSDQIRKMCIIVHSLKLIEICGTPVTPVLLNFIETKYSTEMSTLNFFLINKSWHKNVSRRIRNIIIHYLYSYSKAHSNILLSRSSCIIFARFVRNNCHYLFSFKHFHVLSIFTIFQLIYNPRSKTTSR